MCGVLECSKRRLWIKFIIIIIIIIIIIKRKKIEKIKKSTPTEAPLAYIKHCSWNESPVVPPLIL